MQEQQNEKRGMTELLVSLSFAIAQRVTGCGADQEILEKLGIKANDENTDAQLMYISYVKWARSQFPIIRLGHKLAAALMTSRFDPNLEVNHPWDCFMIDVPDGLLNTTNIAGDLLPIRKIMAFRIDRSFSARGGSWAFVAYAADFTAVWRYGYTAGGMVQTIEERDDIDFFVRMDDTDLKLADLIGRLLVGTACMITNARENLTPGTVLVPEHRKRYAEYLKRPMRGDVPIDMHPLVFRLDSPIKLDLRERVRRYLGGTGQKLEVRSVVRGHWKQQPYGEGRKFRKNIWIEPYERGPEGAPILVQPKIIE